MRHGLLSMRWWLALVFAAIVATTAFFVAEVMTQRSEAAFRARAQELAVGTTVAAASGLVREESEGTLLAVAATDAAKARGLALFLYGSSGNLLTSPESLGVDVRRAGISREVVDRAIAGERVVQTSNDGRRIIVALPLRNSTASAIVGIASRPDLVAAGRIVRGKVIGAVFLAIGLGALIGLVVAFVITSRLRWIAQATAEIERGNFERELAPSFGDELGQLGKAIDRMRVRLRDSFLDLKAERDRLERLLEQLQEGVIAVDRSLRVSFANRRAQLLLGTGALGEGDPLPDPWPELSLAELAAELFGPSASIVHSRVSPTPSKTYAVAGIPARAGVGTAVLVIADVSLQERRERAEREFVTNAAHELRTPLSAISGAVEVLESGAKELPPERDRFLAIVARQTARLGRLVHALLTLARAQTGAEQLEFEQVKLRPLLAEIAAEARAEGADVELTCPARLIAFTHADLLQQAIENLVSNAQKYGGREIEIVATGEDPTRTRIEVIDHGEGLSAEERERVFDRFYRTGERGEGGFGLGLSIVREVVSVLEGEIEIESERGIGTCVAIVLPREGGDNQP
jgi:signal transduction histidine kinase